MGTITPFDKENQDQWRQHNEEVIQNLHDDAVKAIIRGVLNMHELENTGEWKNSGRRIDYSNSTFETYLQHHTTWSLKDFRLLEEVVFRHFDELKRNGMGHVLQRLKRLKKEKDPLAERRKRKRGKR
jgi:hypothetical protein